MNKKSLLILFLCAISFSFVINELNVQYIRKINPDNTQLNTKSLVQNSTIWSADNDWYLLQIRHLINGDGYTLNPNEHEMSVRRTPIYPLFYGLFYTIFGEKNSFTAIKITQTFLFGISAILLVLTVYNLSNGNKSWSLITGVLYAFTPFIPTHLYFTITEGLSPFTVVLTLYVFSLLVKSNKLKHLILCGLSLALCFLTRPLSGVILIGIVGYLFYTKLKTPWNIKSVLVASKKPISLILFFCLFISPWVIRNYILTNELIVAEKIYYGAPMKKGKSLVELRMLLSSWTNPTNLSTEVFSSKLEYNIIANNEKDNKHVIDEYIIQWPDLAFKGFTREELKHALISINGCLIEKHEYRSKNSNFKAKDYLTLPCEEEAFTKINNLRLSFIKENPIRYFLLTPLKTIKETVFNSNMHQFALTNPIDNQLNKWQFALKTISYCLNVLVYLSVVIMLFLKVDESLKILIVIPVVFLAIALTIFLFRYVESRYFLPMYPLMYISLGFVANKFVMKYFYGRGLKNTK